MTRRQLVGAAFVLVALAAACGSFVLARSRYLRDEGGARWIVADHQPWPGIHRIEPHEVAFRTTYRVATQMTEATLQVRAVERASVELDGVIVFADSAPDPLGRETRSIALGPLREGEHSLTIRVVASASRPLLWAQMNPALTATGTDWQSSSEDGGGDWHAARAATDPLRPFPISRLYPHAGAAFARVLPALSVLFMAVAWIGWRGRPLPSPGQLRWALLGFWILLATNNVFRIPAHIGMDLGWHLDYVAHLAVGNGIPLATQGGEMMQPPLAYLLLAPPFVLLSQWLEPYRLVQALRILPMACGALLVELSYRAVRRVHPDRPGAQRVGLLVGGLLPINLYLGHAVANEPFVAAIGGAAAVAMLRVAMTERPPSVRESWVCGALLGLALLAKVTAVLLAPALLAAVAVRSVAGQQPSVSRALASLMRVAGVAALVAGWYYARNWILLGTPFFGTWRPDSAHAWWQEPGYRSAAQYLRFGEALTHPIHAAGVGLWDGLYSSFWLDGWLSATVGGEWAPPWNVAPLLAGAWLALVPTVVIFAGARRALRSPNRARPQRRFSERLAVGTIGLYLAAILYLHLTVPFYCIAKGSYLAAATPLFAVLAASGSAELARSRWVRIGLGAAIACWAANVAATYWVV